MLNNGKRVVITYGTALQINHFCSLYIISWKWWRRTFECQFLLSSPRKYIQPISLQVIVSGLSSPAVLTNDGILNYAKAIGLCVVSHFNV